MNVISYETYDELLNSPLKLQSLDGLDIHSQYEFLKENIHRTVSLQTVPCIAECKAYYFFDALHFEAWHAWPADTPVEQIVSELEQNGWKCSIETSEDGIEIECTCPEMDKTLHELYYEINSISSQIEALDRSIDSELPGVFDADSEPELPDAEFGFVRFGDLPPYGVSVNHLEGVPEKGVSCFPAEIIPNGDFRFTHMNAQLWFDAMEYFEDDDCPIYRLYGELVGYGSDGEPLLKVTKAEKVTGKYIGKPPEVAILETLLPETE